MTSSEADVEQHLRGIPNESTVEQASTNLGLMPSEAPFEELLPAIPNEITVEQIATKLPWASVLILAQVSRGWCHAVRSRQVYNARIRSSSTEWFDIRTRSPAENGHWISVGNFRADSPRHVLPALPIDYPHNVIEPWGRIAAVDGKVYVFGGLDRKVHVLDLGGRRQWTQCANMLKPREEFGCGVIDGKIYVFGGAVKHEYVHGYELCKNSTCHKFRPIVYLRCGYSAPKLDARELAVLYEELPEVFDRFLYRADEGLEPLRQVHAMDLAKDAELLEFYDPMKDEWRLVEPVGSLKERMFIAGKKFYSMSSIGVHVYDFGANSWAHLHSFSFAFASLAPVGSVELCPLAIFTNPCDHGELLVLVEWHNSGAEGTSRRYLFQSIGLGTVSKELLWQRTDSFLSSGREADYLMRKDCVAL